VSAYILMHLFELCMCVGTLVCVKACLKGFPGALPACVFLYAINCACMLVNGCV